ncbi:MAG: NAD(P)H-hydrate dehydratase [Methylococcales bacterium]|nr:NAD(P)H-hydrate dehydratase [Methylococcales bacterium]
MQTLPERLYIVKQTRELDRIAIQCNSIPGIDLMSKAGLVVFELIQAHYSGYNLVIFCGAGNNAGDGYVIAKLALESEIKVNVYTLTNPEQLRGDALIAYQNFMKIGGVVSEFTHSIELFDCVIVDSLLGTGLNRDVTGEYEEAILMINQSACPVVSVDIPSGLNADTGCLMGCSVKADYTVSFIGLKQGMFTGYAAEYCGKISYSSLGISDDVFSQVKYSSSLVTHFIMSKRIRYAHKGEYGHVLLIGGDDGFSGAIRLAAEAALRVGSGLVSVATRVSHSSFINIGRPEIMCRGIEKPDELIPLLNKATAVVIGPGLGQTQWAKNMLKAVLGSKKPLVIDADAINILAKDSLYYDNWILTPHPGEASRLLKCSVDDIARDRFLAISKLQKQRGGIVVLKGAGSLIANDKETTVSTTGNPGMASGGMGDVLAGMIGGLIAQKLDMYKATVAAVYLHGKAADLSAQTNGEIGSLASDLMPFIRRLINQG